MRPLPIGIDDFKKLRENNFCYVDKSLFIQELLDNRSEAVSYTHLDVYKRQMYNHELSYMDVHATMRSLDTNIVNAQPSVLSISVYNCKKKEWYSTEKRGVDYYNEDGAFLAETEELSRLTPIFRKIKVSEQPEAYSYVFSYLMYEYENPGKDSSLVIINQNADWLIEALTQVSKNNGEAKAYLAGKDGTFFPMKIWEKQRK